MKLSALVFLTLGSALHSQTTLGHIDFPTSGTPAAQQHFVQGVLLLHSFEYADAREEFQRASKIEPHFAMAYWGEALTYTHPVWVQQDVDSARAALARLADTAESRRALAPTEREKDYLQSVEILYGTGDKVSRDIAYANAMERMMKKYPGDLEAATLYAVALLGTCQFERQTATYMKAAAVAEEVFAKNPQHPGAIHYLIHAYDDPAHAPLGLRAARVYGKVAGSASHAQHMPAHIFFALGMWDEAIRANRASIAVADERIQKRGLSASERNYHSLTWLEYAYLQEGRVDEARQLLSTITLPEPLKHMRTIFAVETGAWDHPATDLDLGRGDVLGNVAVLNTEGLVHLAQGRIEEARVALDGAKKLLSAPSSHSSHSDMPRMPEPENTLKLAQLMVAQLEGAIQFAEGKTAEGLAMIAQTAAGEDALVFEFGPPTPVKPAHELYAELLVKAGKAEEALHQFNLALRRAPGRRLSVLGLRALQHTEVGQN